MNYPARYHTALLKYSATEDAPYEFKALAASLEPQDRWGGPEADHTKRGVLADWLRERGREYEADLLNNPEQHVLVLRGKVHPAKFTDEHITKAARYADRYAYGGSHGSPLDRISWSSRFNRDIDHEGAKPIPSGHVRVWPVEEFGWIPHDAEPNTFVHHRDLGPHLAAHIQAADAAFREQYGPASPPDTEAEAEFQRRLQALRDAPYERTLTASERKAAGHPPLET